jgi:predicted dehydrogenase
MLCNYLLIGSGNIAIRHASNIKLISKKNKIFFLTQNNSRSFKDLCRRNNFYCFKDIKYLKKMFFFSIFICTSSRDHLKYFNKFYHFTNNFFIEKPISNKLSKAIKIYNSNKKIIQIGYNLIFDAKLKYLKNYICSNKKKNGKLYRIECGVGHCLTQWRLHRDYKKTVSANKDLGGGVLLELSHEINYLIWLFGRIAKISAGIHKISKLKVNVEDYATKNLIFKNNLIGTLNIDFIRKDKTRYLNLIFEKSTISLDFVANYIKINDGNKVNIIKFKLDDNQSYIDQFKFFLDLIKKKRKDPNLNIAIDTLRVIDAARISNKSNSKMIKIKYE